MQEITSTTNDLIKETAKLQQKKYRVETNLFLLEGEKAVKEAIEQGVKVKNFFVLKDKENKFLSLSDKIILVNEAVMKKISDTQSPPEILAVAEQISYSTSDFKNKKKLILLENVKDSGNLGTIIRTSAALGVEGIFLVGDCVDIYNPKTIRSAVGNLFKIPFISLSKIQEVKKIFCDHSFISTVLDGENIKLIALPQKFVLMLGAEATGLSNDAIALSDIKVTIPMNKSVESLNLAASASIVIWELFNR